jgi:hypothetical protein
MKQTDASLKRQHFETIHILDPAPEPRFDDIAKLATKIWTAPIDGKPYFRHTS